MPEHVHPSLRDPITHGGQLAPGLRAATGSYANQVPAARLGFLGAPSSSAPWMAADPAQAVDTLVDEIADLEIDEDLLNHAQRTWTEGRNRFNNKTPRAEPSGAGRPCVRGVGDDLTFRLVLGRRRNDHEALSGYLRHLQVLHDRPVLGRPKAWPRYLS